LEVYLNGKRTLGADHLSHFFFSSPFSKSSLTASLENAGSMLEEEKIPDSDEPMQYDILIAATHFLGDGMALHNFATEFFSLLSSQVGPTQLSIDTLLQAEWEKHCSVSAFETKEALPKNMEQRLPSLGDRYRRAASRIDFQNYERKLIVSFI
jgi:hypothetical protein